MQPLLRQLALVLVIACATSVVSQAQAPVLRGELVIEGTVDSSYGFSIERVVSNGGGGNVGGVVLRGTFSDSISVEGSRLTSRGLADGFLCSVDDRLRLQWLKSFGGAGYDAITCMAPLPDGGLVVGMLCGAGVNGVTSYRIGEVTFSGRGGADAVVFAMNADGTVRWVRNDGSFNAEYPTSITVLSDSLIIVAGVFLRESRFGTESVSDSCEISGYVQAITKNGAHRWVRVVRGAALDGPPLAVRIQPLHIHAMPNGTAEVVVTSSEAIVWSDSTIAGPNAELYGTTAIITIDSDGKEVDIVGLATCPAAQTVFGSNDVSISAASAEYVANACTALPFDVITFRADARTTHVNSVDVPSPGVKQIRSSARGRLISGSTDQRALILALEPQGNERWRYLHNTLSGAMYDAFETDSAITAVVMSDKLSLLQFGFSTGVLDDANAEREHLDKRVITSAELSAFIRDGCEVWSLTGCRLWVNGSSASKPIVPQVCMLRRDSGAVALVLLVD